LPRRRQTGRRYRRARRRSRVAWRFADAKSRAQRLYAIKRRDERVPLSVCVGDAQARALAPAQPSEPALKAAVAGCGAVRLRSTPSRRLAGRAAARCARACLLSLRRRGRMLPADARCLHASTAARSGDGGARACACCAVRGAEPGRRSHWRVRVRRAPPAAAC
jgi:hypothetical protein